jgi:hypothetical protein
MTTDLYGHLVDTNLREAARAIGGILGASEPPEQQDEDADDAGSRRKCPVATGFWVEPPTGIEPMTYALRGACLPAFVAWPARIPQRTTAMTLGFRGLPFHDPFHDQSSCHSG